MYNLENKTILVLGFAKTGKSVANFLLKKSASVIINDRSDLESNHDALLLQNQGAILIGKGHPVSILDQPIDLIVKNPGIPYSIPLIESAMEKGIPIVTDVELFSVFQEGILVGITGSNGKTTTTTLVHNILSSAYSNVHLAGNIGIPSLEILEDVKPGDITVMELSSFQLMGTDQFHPKIAAITNIYEAHLDYHGTKDDYIKAKQKIASNMGPNDVLIYNADQIELRDWVKNLSCKVLGFSRQYLNEEIKKSGGYVNETGYYVNGSFVMDHEGIHLPGEHNQENILVAVMIAKLLDVSDETIKRAVQNFQGVEYRIQPLGNFGGVQVFNDSKATNPSATITALNSFKQPIHYIGGGLDRGIDFSDLSGQVEMVKRAYLYGESKWLMKKFFDSQGIENHIFDKLDEAGLAALQNAQKGEVVLFSPACASWDQFENYEKRGLVFSQLVQNFFQKNES